MEEVGAAIKEIIHYDTIRGKFSSVHPDLVAEGITRVEVGEEGLHFIKENTMNQVSFDIFDIGFKSNVFSEEPIQEAEMPDPVRS